MVFVLEKDIAFLGDIDYGLFCGDLLIGKGSIVGIELSLGREIARDVLLGSDSGFGDGTFIICRGRRSGIASSCGIAVISSVRYDWSGK